MAIDIQRGRSFQSKQPQVVGSSSEGSSFGFMAPEWVAHNVAMRLKNAKAKFFGDASEYWDKYVDVANQIAKDFRLSDE